jgi:hypothetical protein
MRFVWHRQIPIYMFKDEMGQRLEELGSSGMFIHETEQF